jgi:hypothetical protein
VMTSSGSVSDDEAKETFGEWDSHRTFRSRKRAGEPFPEDVERRQPVAAIDAGRRAARAGQQARRPR